MKILRNETYNDMVQNIESLNVKVNNLKLELSSVRKEKINLSKELDKSKLTIEDITNYNKSLERDNTNFEDNISKLEKENKKLLDTNVELGNSIEELELEIKNEKEKNSNLEKEIEALKENVRKSYVIQSKEGITLKIEDQNSKEPTTELILKKDKKSKKPNKEVANGVVSDTLLNTPKKKTRKVVKNGK